MQQTVAFCCSWLSWNRGLVWDQAEIFVQFTFKYFNTFRINVSNGYREKVENFCTLDRNRYVPSSPHSSWCTSNNSLWGNTTPPSFTGYERYTKAFNHALGNFPEENYHIPLSPALLRIEVHGAEPLPVVHVLQANDLGYKMALD